MDVFLFSKVGDTRREDLGQVRGRKNEFSL